ncbi:hypothetical protein [Psychromicrobium sp. YIM B11713]|uniref:hypothetical protein n=1 Tax=Psychromicrobium sp. YIM B11713 TaxID=3145233 RepID=UPI00374F8A7E
MKTIKRTLAITVTAALVAIGGAVAVAPSAEAFTAYCKQGNRYIQDGKGRAVVYGSALCRTGS